MRTKSRERVRQDREKSARQGHKRKLAAKPPQYGMVPMGFMQVTACDGVVRCGGRLVTSAAERHRLYTEQASKMMDTAERMSLRRAFGIKD